MDFFISIIDNEFESR